MNHESKLAYDKFEEEKTRKKQVKKIKEIDNPDRRFNSARDMLEKLSLQVKQDLYLLETVGKMCKTPDSSGIRDGLFADLQRKYRL